MSSNHTHNKTYWETNTFAPGVFEGTVVTNGVLTLDHSSVLTGTDESDRYNSGAYFYGSYTTEPITATLQEAIASWQSETPSGTWLEVELRAEVEGVWSKWYSMGVWLTHLEPFNRHSVNGQGDEIGTVYTDTLVLKQLATALQVKITLFTTDPGLTPSVRGLQITAAIGKGQPGVVPSTGVTSDLTVPKRSQMVFPNGGNVWCSPTSISMVMAYWAHVTGNSAWDLPVPTVVNGVWDAAYNGAGNWPFNTAYASGFGLQAKIVRLHSLADAEPWTAAGVPLIVSVAYQEGDLDGSPMPAVAGHLVVIRGFTAEGDVLTNDPAAPSDEEVTITYRRDQFEKCWLAKSNGITYILHPEGWNVPAL